jgi:hypothetical protein
MKRTGIPIILLFGISTMIISSIEAQNVVKTTTKVPTWKKTKDNSWPGLINEEVYWYRLDQQSKLWWSPDGRKWNPDSDGMWADGEGVFYKLENGRLVWSTDGASTWNDAPEWKWMAVDSNWYKLDKDGIVWKTRK